MPSQTPQDRAANEHIDARSAEEQLVAKLQKQSLGRRLLGYTKLSGPGWLQSAITLGGGTLASSLYLGVLGGFSLLWLQPLAMILGIVMLSSISYVALSCRERPFQAINRHINPVLGWGWALATLAANIVWALPQFSLGTAAVRQNLLPGIFGPGNLPEFWDKCIVAGALLAVSVYIIWIYDRGSAGVKLFERLLKALVGLIVISFIGVVIVISVKGVLNWGHIARGFIPDFSLLSRPAASFSEYLGATGEYASYWKARIVGDQRDVMISAFAAAVGINMTFLMPYALLARGWNRHFRGLAIFDLSIGLFVPYLLVTVCIITASAAQFHTQYYPGLVDEQQAQRITEGEESVLVKYEKVPVDLLQKYQANLDDRLMQEIGRERFMQMDEAQVERARDALPVADKRMAAMLIKRDAFDLAESLQPLTGRFFSQFIFGLGVVGVALSSAIIMMLISGFVVCEMLGIPPEGSPRRWACMIAAVGVLGPFVWTGKTQFWLAVPTSVFGMTLLPIAYWTFFMMMNSRRVLGDNMPSGGTRILWNALMLVAAGLATFGSFWSLWNKARWIGVLVVVAFLSLVLIVHLVRKSKKHPLD